MIEAITRILDRCGSDDSVLPPTEVFNEGWLLRLTLDWFERHHGFSHPLSFLPESRWYSEALLPSRFLPQSRADTRAESFTHADGVIGHFAVISGIRGEASVLPSAKQFIVTEAKLGSALSAGTKNAPSYDQAARNVACMAHMLSISSVEPSSVERFAFYVIAPEAQIKAGLFGTLVTKESIEFKVRERVASYEGTHDEWLHAAFLPALAHIEVGTMSWESILSAMPDTAEIEVIRAFYVQCLRFNPLRTKSSP
jgi:hypothetical protein